MRPGFFLVASAYRIAKWRVADVGLDVLDNDALPGSQRPSARRFQFLRYTAEELEKVSRKTPLCCDLEHRVLGIEKLYRPLVGVQEFSDGGEHFSQAVIETAGTPQSRTAFV